MLNVCQIIKQENPFTALLARPKFATIVINHRF